MAAAAFGETGVPFPERHGGAADGERAWRCRPHAAPFRWSAVPALADGDPSIAFARGNDDHLRALLAFPEDFAAGIVGGERRRRADRNGRRRLGGGRRVAVTTGVGAGDGVSVGVGAGGR